MHFLITLPFPAGLSVSGTYRGLNKNLNQKHLEEKFVASTIILRTKIGRLKTIGESATSPGVKRKNKTLCYRNY